MYKNLGRCLERAGGERVWKNNWSVDCSAAIITEAEKAKTSPRESVQEAEEPNETKQWTTRRAQRVKNKEQTVTNWTFSRQLMTITTSCIALLWSSGQVQNHVTMGATRKWIKCSNCKRHVTGGAGRTNPWSAQCNVERSIQLEQGERADINDHTKKMD